MFPADYEVAFASVMPFLLKIAAVSFKLDNYVFAVQKS
jgi:hypothetical protein